MKSEKPKASALDAALKLLARKDYSAAELSAKLASRGYSEEDVGAVLQVLRRYHYVAETGSDLRALEKMSAEWLAKRRRGITAGVLRGLEAYLLKKGFDPDVVSSHLRKLAEQALAGGSDDGAA